MQIKAKRRHREGKEQNPETKAALSKKAVYYCLQSSTCVLVYGFWNKLSVGHLKGVYDMEIILSCSFLQVREQVYESFSPEIKTFI